MTTVGHTLANASTLTLETLAEAAATLPVAAPVDRGAFVREYYAHARLEELGLEPKALAAAALAHLQFALQRAPRAAKIRVLNPMLEHDGYTCQHTVVEAVNDDMPFLVDSLSMALVSMGHAIHVTTHPVLRVQRSASGELRSVEPAGPVGPNESLIHFEIVRETNPEILLEIERRLLATLRDVRAAVDDWEPMVAKLKRATEELRARSELPAELKDESVALLEWLADDHFTLLGYREYDLAAGAAHDDLTPRAETGLGLLRPELGPRGISSIRLTGAARAAARSPEPLVITKSNLRSTVHRSVPFDHVGVKVFGPDGLPVLEKRFLGLFTSTAYSSSPRTIPLLRQKIREILRGSGLDPRGHRSKSLQHLLDTLPRDDLFQASTAELRAIGYGLLDLQELHRVKLFCRLEPFGRFYSCLVYLPREQYNSRARRAAAQTLLHGLSGSSVESEVAVSEALHARISITVHVAPGKSPEPDFGALEREVEEAVRTWQDRLREALLSRLAESEALELLRRFGERFSAAYQDEVDAARASVDIASIARLDDGASELEVDLVASGGGDALRLTAFRPGDPIVLHRALPILESFGFKAISERAYALRGEGKAISIQDFDLRVANGRPVDTGAVVERFKRCFALVLGGRVENDGFNSFVVSAGFDWRECVLLRAICKYLLQTGIRYSQTYMQEVLARYPDYCRALVDKFRALFDPDSPPDERSALLAAAATALAAGLDRAVSLDDDRILRAYAAIVDATLRTNYYQRTQDGEAKPYVSLKLDPGALPELPKPRPKFEIFVYSERVEGVHLRSSSIARGGIRWSDRREDFRTEVLGLMKALQVKNTVIVPNGAKGGFVPKVLPQGDRDAVQREVIACYQTFIRGLLDVTDNIVDGRVRAPQRGLRRDTDDPYLVVAADKGTAAFSDIANALAAEYGFWLGDAFASGGSAGYDHKKIAITARGAWEAVKRHFRELGVDVQQQAFTAVGIGDMSGDVFGNGMLLSPHLALVAAFDHRHVFIDPNPDRAASFAERRRLFERKASSWDDYDRTALSSGGGVFSRQSKAVELSAEARERLGVHEATLSPNALIRAILTAPVDLLWNGGIGTYVKASSESHTDAADPANDVVRVDGLELRCRVVGEGGNLGFTQRGRIEYAQRGGRINTDFIDNAGGVDSSDREVNIKILLEAAIRANRLPREQRNALLAQMTADVVERVLASNYAQTQALSMMESRAAERLSEHTRLIRALETEALLDRALEFLPNDEQLEERRAKGLGLTRPELAIILSYSKIELADSIAQTDLPEDGFLARELEAYFPSVLADRFPAELRAHPLRREIIAMLIGGSMINRMGPFFVLRAEEEMGANVAHVARAYAIVREVFGVRQIWRKIEALDYRAPAASQYRSIFQISRTVRRAVYWLLQNRKAELDIESTVLRLKPGIELALAALPAVVTGRRGERLARDIAEIEESGLPVPLAQQIATLWFMTEALEIVMLSKELDIAVPEIARLYFVLSVELRFDVVREHIERLKAEGRWRSMARATLRHRLAQGQRSVLRSALAHRGDTSPDEALAAWLDGRRADIARAQHALDEMQRAGAMDFPTISVALSEITRLVETHYAD
jgi:glutamate dehydrogenase